MAIIRTTTSGNEQAVAASTDTDDSTTTTVATRPELGFSALGAGLFAIGLIVGLLFLHHRHPGLTNLPTVAKGTSVFAVLYIFAQAIERLLVPVSWVGGGFTKDKTKKAVKQKSQNAQLALLKSTSEDKADKEKLAGVAANAQHDVDQYRANLTATSFGVASLLAFIASGYSGALLLNIAGIKVSGWLDLVVTGLAVAGGTKPLHDVISNVSSAGAAKSS